MVASSSVKKPQVVQVIDSSDESENENEEEEEEEVASPLPVQDTRRLGP